MYTLPPAALLLLLTCAVVGVISLPLSNHTKPQGWAHHLPTHELVHRDFCEYEGNSDLYGLGIRLGVYCQLLSSFLANHYHREVMKDAWDTNVIFLLAVFIGIVRSTVTNQLHPIEGFIMLQMLFAFLLSVVHVRMSFGWLVLYGIGTVSNYTPVHVLVQAHREFSALGAVARACLRMAISAYNIWFWFKGFEALPTLESCPPTIFLFAPVRLGKARIFLQFISILYFYVTGSAPAEIGSVIIVCRRLWASRHRSGSGPQTPLFQNVKELLANVWKWYLSSSRPATFPPDEFLKPSRDPDTIKLTNILVPLRRALLIYTMIIIIWAILTIELTLQWSDISGVYGVQSVGQLIALVVGAAGLLRTVHLIIIDKAISRSNMRGQGPIQSIPLVPGTGVWKYRLRDNRIANFPEIHAQQLRRWSFDGPIVEAYSAQRQLPLKPTMRSEESLSLPQHPGAFSFSESMSSAKHERRYIVHFKSFIRGMLNLPPEESSYYLERPSDITIPYNKDNEFVLPSGKIQVFLTIAIDRRHSIGYEQEARELTSRMPFAPYVMDPPGHEGNALRATAPNRETLLSLQTRPAHSPVSDARNKNKPTSPPQNIYTYQLRNGQEVHFLKAKPERRRSEGDMNPLNEETTDYHGWKDEESTGSYAEAVKERKILRYCKSGAAIFLTCCIVICLFPILVILGGCLRKLEEEEEERKEDDDNSD